MAARRGLLTGGTGGAVIYKMVEYLVEHQVKGKVVGIVPDGGEQYLTTIFNDEWMQRYDLFDSTVWEFLDQHLSS
jgi:cystathionine beta-synthase